MLVVRPQIAPADAGASHGDNRVTGFDDCCVRRRSQSERRRRYTLQLRAYSFPHVARSAQNVGAHRLINYGFVDHTVADAREALLCYCAACRVLAGKRAAHRGSLAEQ